MATATIVRPSSTIRRKESVRPLPERRGGSIDNTIEVANSRKRKRTEPYIRDSQYILRKHRGKPPSLIIHLHTTHFRFDGQDGSFAYDSPMRIVLKHLRLQTVPHDILEELLASNVPFYDGCLIVEVHNHRVAESKKDGDGTERKVDDTKKFSMNSWNQHITPSPFAAYPSKAQLDQDGSEEQDDTKDTKINGIEKEGPKISTVVLHPTEQTRHEELLILAKTPAADVKRKKGDNSIPTTPNSLTPGGSRTLSNASQKMALDQNDLYTFHGDMLVATEPPLYLAPAEDAAEAQAVLNMLEHPLHSARPPAPKERKRTTAEMAADDAQAAETERRLLIMDERMKPSARTGAGTTSGENQAAAASLGFSRFKTIELVRQKLEEAARLKKAEDERAAQEKRQYDEQMQAQQKQAAAAKLREMQVEQSRRMQMQAQAQLQQQRQQQQQHLQNQQAAQQHNQQMMQSQMQNGVNHQQVNGFHHQVTGTQASPVVAQQTPLVSHSSPMVSQNGFPMLPSSSQGAGSPPRPPSAMQQNTAMARNQSQQAHPSNTNTPHMNQGGTPSLANAVPNRNMSQTPRVNPSSPMVGTPATNNMQMPTPRMNGNLNSSQDIILQQMQNQQANGMAVQPPGNQVNGMSAMTPEQIQFARQMSRLSEISRQSQAQAQQATQAGNPNLAAQYMQRAQHVQQQYNAMRQRLLTGGQMQGGNQPPAAQIMNHAHPNGSNMQQGQQNQNAALLAQQQQHMAQQQANVMRTQQQQQQQQQQMRLQNELRQIVAQNNNQMPPIQTLPPHLQPFVIKQQQNARLQQQQQQAQAQAQARNQAQARMGMPMNQQGSPQPNGQTGAYMQNMQALRNGLAMQMQNQGQNQGQNGNDMNNAMMAQLAMQQRQQQAQQQAQQNGTGAGGGDLSSSFAAMQNALARGQGMH